MRLIYTDESGISINESVVVVAGVMVDADRQWKAVEKYVHKLVAEYIPKENQSGFVFHATDLFRGSGKIFGNRKKYPLGRSREALKNLVTIPALFRLPIVCGCVRKPEITKKLTKEGRRHNAAKHQMLAYGLCVAGAEKYIKENADPSEIAKLFAENNTDTGKAVKFMHELLQGRNLHIDVHKWMFDELLHTVPNSLPLTRIVESVAFEGKSESIFLQIADACALVLRYFYEARNDIDDLLNAISNNNPTVLGNRKKYGGFLTLGWKSKKAQDQPLA